VAAVARGPFAAQGIVAPLAGDPVEPLQDLPVDDDAPAAAGAEDEAHDDRPPAGGTEARLGQGKAVGVVRDPRLDAEVGGQVLAQALAVQAGGVRVLEHPGGRVGHAGGAESDPARPLGPGLLLQAGDQPGDLRADVAVALGAFGRHPQPAEGTVRAPGVDHRPLDLGSPQVDAVQAHGLRGCDWCGSPPRSTGPRASASGAGSQSRRGRCRSGGCSRPPTQSCP